MTSRSSSIVEYVSSEQFISDGILRRSEAVLEVAVEQYNHGNRGSFALLWPGREIKSDDGGSINDVLIFPRPGGVDPVRWIKDHLRAAIKRTAAYAFLDVHRGGDGMTAFFESPHIRRTWVYRARREGDVMLLGSPEVENGCMYHLIKLRGQNG